MKTLNELKLAKELIRFPSITPVDAGIMKFLEKKLKKLGFKTKILEFKERGFQPVKNLYARLGSKKPNFMFAGHVDIVPPGNIKDWTINPFRPSIKKGHLIGRGANDMKSSVAAFVSAVSTFLSKNRKFNGSISLLITGDEEGDAVNGTKKVVDYLKKRKEKINFCLVGEPTNPNKLGEMIKIGRRGSLTGKLNIFGQQGHVAYPHRANNPSTIIVKILKELKDIKFDRGSKNFQPTNLEVTKINIDNSANNVVTEVIIVRDKVSFIEIFVSSNILTSAYLRKFSLTLSNITTVSFIEYPTIVKTAATIERLISNENTENTPNVIITSWNKAKIAPRLNCHSNLIHIYKSIAAKDKAIAITPDL